MYCKAAEVKAFCDFPGLALQETPSFFQETVQHEHSASVRGEEDSQPSDVCDAVLLTTVYTKQLKPLHSLELVNEMQGGKAGIISLIYQKFCCIWETLTLSDFLESAVMKY